MLLGLGVCKVAVVILLSFWLSLFFYCLPLVTQEEISLISVYVGWGNLGEQMGRLQKYIYSV